MPWPFQAGGDILVAEEAIAKNGSHTSGWKTVSKGEAFHFGMYMTATGAPDVTITVDYWFWGEGKAPPDQGTVADVSFDVASAARNNYFTVTLKANETTKDTWTRYNCPAELEYPFVAYRVKVTENDVAAVDTISVICCNNRT